MLRSRKPARDTGPDFWTREMVRLRFFGRCCRCGRDGETIQHRAPRGMGGSTNGSANAPSNLLWVCGDGTRKCHGHMESHRAEAYDNGWLVPHGSDSDATAARVRSTPVLLWDGRRVLLDDDGEWELVTATAPSLPA